MKQAFIVIGPESSGTRLMTRVLIACGCIGGSEAEPNQAYKWWPQKWDVDLPTTETPIVIRRTIPYHPARTWYQPDIMHSALTQRGYDITYMVMHRRFDCMAASQVRNKYVRSLEVAYGEIRDAYELIRKFRNKTPALQIVHVSYEMIVDLHYAYLNNITDVYGLKWGFCEVIYDGNRKYKGEP